MIASCNGHMDSVKLLLDRGAEFNMQTKVSEFHSISFSEMIFWLMLNTCVAFSLRRHCS